MPDDSEAAVLERLCHRLELDGESAAAVQAQADRLRGDRRQYMPRSEALPWWEHFAELLTQVLVQTAASGCAGRAVLTRPSSVSSRA